MVGVRLGTVTSLGHALILHVPKSSSWTSRVPIRVSTSSFLQFHPQGFSHYLSSASANVHPWGLPLLARSDRVITLSSLSPSPLRRRRKRSARGARGTVRHAVTTTEGGAGGGEDVRDKHT
ncbi:unnamed protein product, partial [Choristocarpus tenellus]